MTILATRPPIPGTSFLHEDLGLELVTAAIRDAGIECRFRDGLQEHLSPRHWVTQLCDAPEDVLFVTLHAEVWADQVLSMLQAVKREAPQKTVVLGGHPVSTLDRAIFETYPDAFDVLVRGDGEQAAVDLARATARGSGSFDRIAGLSIKQDSRLVRTPHRARARDYDRLPFAARDVWENGLDRPATESALIWLGRGCDYACKFCSVVTFYGREERHWAHRSIDLFLEEVEQVKTRHDVRDFTIVDPDFLGNPAAENRHAQALCDALEASRLEIIWDIAVRADQIDHSLLDQMYRAGLRRVFLGLESGLDSELAQWRKGLKAPRGLEVARWCADMGIYTQIGFILLRPESTLEDIEGNLQFLRSLPYFELVSLSAPLWLLHGVPATQEVADRSIIEFHGRIQRSFVFDDPRSSSYVAAVQILIGQVAPHFSTMRDAMWQGMAQDATIIHRYRDATGGALSHCLDVADRIVAAIRSDPDGSARSRSALEERAYDWAADAEREVAAITEGFG